MGVCEMDQWNTKKLVAGVVNSYAVCWEWFFDDKDIVNIQVFGRKRNGDKGIIVMFYIDEDGQTTYATEPKPDNIYFVKRVINEVQYALFERVGKHGVAKKVVKRKL